MPAAPAARPADIFSDWDNNPWNRHAWGLLTPKYEIAGMFSYINFIIPGYRNWNNLGATGSFTYNANRWIGLTAEIGAYSFKRQIYVMNTDGSVSLSSLRGSQETYLDYGVYMIAVSRKRTL